MTPYSRYIYIFIYLYLQYICIYDDMSDVFWDQTMAQKPYAALMKPHTKIRPDSSRIECSPFRLFCT